MGRLGLRFRKPGVESGKKKEAPRHSRERPCLWKVLAVSGWAMACALWGTPAQMWCQC